ncbi:common plant regulatory factor 1-like isoform X1 [Salvia splendens]|uniref:common plant regulatory factor 1-like isoform X1 n=1 Tax=Salvia splendens TaxID=180675 RepID=UPI001C270C88|nr:common plant regulatory factor 1-like isoform X1 [Salvia splendens]
MLSFCKHKLAVQITFRLQNSEFTFFQPIESCYITRPLLGGVSRVVPEHIMGNSEEGKGTKLEISTPPAVDQNNMHMYPDWAAMQAYYGPRFAVPPYMNSAVASLHAPPPYMWGPPHSMIPPYGAPYAAFYAHGGVYAHPGVPMAGTAMSVETPAKSSGNTDGVVVKKLKEFDGLAISICNGNGDGTENGTEQRQSTDSDETGGSSDGSNAVAPGQANQNGKKRNGQGSPKKEDGKAPKSSLAPLVDVSQASGKMMDVIPPANKPVKAVNVTLEVKEPSPSAISSPASVPLHSIPNDNWMQNERELKRERRKQSNRESARRSRLRKQAETEELAVKVEALTSENMTLKSRIHELMESSGKLKLENAALIEKLKETQLGQREEANLHNIDDPRLKPVSTVNLLARVNNSDSSDNRNEDSSDSYDNSSRHGAKLRQLLDSSPRTDAVVTG